MRTTAEINEMADLYRHYKSANKVASMFNVSPPTILKYLRLAGVNLFAHSSGGIRTYTDEDAIKIIDIYNTYGSINKVAHVTGLGRKLIAAALKK